MTKKIGAAFVVGLGLCAFACGSSEGSGEDTAESMTLLEVAYPCLPESVPECRGKSLGSRCRGVRGGYGFCATAAGEARRKKLATGESVVCAVCAGTGDGEDDDVLETKPGSSL